MSTSFLSELNFSNTDGRYLTSSGYRRWAVSNAIILYGSAVTLGDQQHEDNNGVNYVSCFVKYVRVRGVIYTSAYNTLEDTPDCDLTFILYKCPVKYENGMVSPVVKYSDFVQMKDYFLYSSPGYVLALKKYRPPDYLHINAFEYANVDVELVCSKKFVIGPTDVLCLTCLATQSNATQPVRITPRIASKVVYDFN